MDFPFARTRWRQEVGLFLEIAFKDDRASWSDPVLFAKWRWLCGFPTGRGFGNL
jgi:hypothetical protein